MDLFTAVETLRPHGTKRSNGGDIVGCTTGSTTWDYHPSGQPLLSLPEDVEHTHGTCPKRKNPANQRESGTQSRSAAPSSLLQSTARKSGQVSAACRANVIKPVKVKITRATKNSRGGWRGGGGALRMAPSSQSVPRRVEMPSKAQGVVTVSLWKVLSPDLPPRPRTAEGLISFSDEMAFIESLPSLSFYFSFFFPLTF